MPRPFLLSKAVLLGAGCSCYLVLAGCSKDTVIPTRPERQGFAVSSVTASVNRANYSGPCPGNFEFSANITANDSGVVVYRWERSDGLNGPLTIAMFSAAGTQTVTSSWSTEGHGSFWQRLHVLAPNEVVSGEAAFTNQCGTTITATAYVAPLSNGSTCPGTYDFTANITADAPAYVSYRWEGSDGQIGPWLSLGLQEGNPTTVTMSRVMIQNGTFWERVHILAPVSNQSSPVDVYSTKANFENYCSGFAATATVWASDGACRDVIDFWADITTTGQGTVTYRWERSDGEMGPTETLEFTAAGTQTVTTSSQSPTGGAFSERVHILSPNDKLSNEAIGEPNWDSCCWGCDPW